ncbi:MAG TPA: ketoacyl-ACP synthase III [Syntrophothermus lipocalidus]|uniref:Beta-ketoacyl-[acyl-carrier-protein] synthase III n=1 Tax=Syntrophothermus lipocalidus (strain DSM 12680 / TGB-C1) TaxID=643648 RepID=D7CNC8_SYNLT|nr:beta-ketoacyl-ACP synthase III [Syntrophothermus lipocalidus]ADI02213.1 3-oxoacyl-(acyl-carrier-protein) synthase III [Syntrophothermus lipocalidus DSM 12680]HHV75944.1 ketoacyl-ACP synthase III [Syntrophothermus lipocalidus]
MRAQILGTGYALPSRILSNDELEQMVDTSDEWIVTRTGIKERRICDSNKAASDLGYEAARMAIARAGISPLELDLIVVATVTPDMLFPSTACLIQDMLGAANAAAFDLSAGCTGFIYALAVAERYLVSPNCRHVLVVGVEILSRITDYTDRNTCVLFGDGAGAMVLGKGEGPYGILSTRLGADGKGRDLLYMPAGGSRLPSSVETVANRQHFIKMAGNEVFKFATRVVPDYALRVLKDVGLDTGDVDHVVLHQANIRILQAAAKRLRVPWEKMVVNIDRYGNMSSATVPVAVAEAVEDNRIKTGDLVLMVAFGAGLTMGSVLVRWGRD